MSNFGSTLSDEPKAEHLSQYRTAQGILSPLIKGCYHIDALSDYDFYREGLVETPVVATNRIEPYLDAKVEGMWCYYCCSQCVDVANRFFCHALGEQPHHRRADLQNRYVRLFALGL